MKKEVFLLCALFALTSAVDAQTTHFTFTSNTGNNATVAIPLSADPNINGIALQPGDEIGVFADGLVNPDSFCVGAVVWNGTNTAITVWGDNDQTPQLDGIRAGTPMYFHVWQKSTGSEYSSANVNYSQGNGVYSPNGIYILSSLSISTTMTFDRSSIPFGSVEVDSVAEEWIHILNNSSDPIAIDSIYTGTRWFHASPTHGTLRGHDSVTVQISFLPDSARIYRDTLFITSNSLPPIAKLPLLGNGAVSTAVRTTPSTPKGFRLYQNYPNPFNPSTVINYYLPTTGYVSLRIYDCIGREVATLISGIESAGSHSATFDATDLPSGAYFYTLRMGTHSVTSKLLLLK